MKEAEMEEQNTAASQMPSLHLSARALWGAEQGFCFVSHRNSDDCACLGVCFFGELLSSSEFKGSKTTLIRGSDWCWPRPIERVWLHAIKARNSPKRQKKEWVQREEGGEERCCRF